MKVIDYINHNADSMAVIGLILSALFLIINL